MPVIKFRSVEEMDRAPLGQPAPNGEALVRRIDRLWRRAAALAPPRHRPRGVFRFRSVFEAQAAREQLERGALEE